MNINMNIKIIFRILIVAPVLLMLVYYFLPSIEYLWLSCDEINLLEVDGYNAYLPKNYIFFIIYMIIGLGVSTGLLFFIQWFRIVYIVFVVLSVILIFFLGNRVSSPLATVIVFLMTLSIGAVLALMYSTSTKALFSKEDESEKQSEEDDEDDFR